MKDSLIVNEIFSSIDGEGLRTGELATFIRLAGCNLRCRYCDTAYSLNTNQGKRISIDKIINKLKSLKNKNITLTGGEPLIQKESFLLIDKLIENGFNVNIETNGAVDITPLLDKNVLITLDYKTISSEMNNRMLLDNLEKLRETDVLKIVCNRNDFKDIKKLLKKKGNRKIISYN